MNYDYLKVPDPKIVAFQKALGQKESSNNPNPNPTRITQTEGSVGRFQYLPETFQRYGKQYFGGVNPLTGKPLDINNDLDQKVLNYAYVKDKMDKGYSPYDIAASWNAGEGRISDWQNMKGVNSAGNAYDVPAYASEVVHNAKEIYKQTKDPAYQSQTYDSRIHSLDGMARDQDVALQLREQELAREKELQDVKDSKPLGDFLSPVTDFLIDSSEGMKKAGTQWVTDVATTANDLFNYSDNPLLIRGSESFDQFRNKGTEGDNTSQTIGGYTAEGVKFAAEAALGSKLATTAFGALAGGASGAALQKAILSKSLVGVASRLGLSAVVQQAPFLVDSLLSDPSKTSVLNDVALPTVVTMLIEGALTKGKVGAFGSALERVAKLRAAGKLEEAAKLVESTEFTKALIPYGIKNADDLARVASEEVGPARNALQEILPTSTGLKVAGSSDDTIKQVLSNFSKTLDSNGNFNTLDDVMKMRKAGEELMDGADDLSKNISKQLTLEGKNIDLGKFKASLIADLEQKVTSGELLKTDFDKFEKFIEKNITDTPKPNGAFDFLHKLRKKLNLDYTDGDYDAARYIADKIRRVVKNMPDSAEISAYKKANQTYGDIQDAEAILARLNKKGANVSKTTIQALSGVLASGGGFAPVQYFLGQRMGGYLADKIKRAYTPRLVGNTISRLGSNPLVEAHRAVKEAVEMTGKKISKIEGELTDQTIRDLKTTLFNAKKPEDLIAAKKLIKQLAGNEKVTNLGAFEDYLKKRTSKINTQKELEEFIGTPEQWAEVEKAAKNVIPMGRPGVSKYKKVDPNLPSIDIGKMDPAPKPSLDMTDNFKNPKVNTDPRMKTLAEKVKEKMIKSGANLPTILGAVIGIGALSSMTPDSASAMTAEDNDRLNLIQRMFSSDPVEVNKADTELTLPPGEVNLPGTENMGGIPQPVETPTEPPVNTVPDPKKYPAPKLTPSEISKIRATLFVEAGGKNQKEIQGQAEKILKVLYNRMENGKDTFKGKNLAQLIDSKEFDGLRMKQTKKDFQRILNQKYKPEDKIKVEAINWALDNLIKGQLERDTDHLFYSATGSDFRTYPDNKSQMSDRYIDKKGNFFFKTKPKK